MYKKEHCNCYKKRIAAQCNKSTNALCLFSIVYHTFPILKIITGNKIRYTNYKMYYVIHILSL